MESENPSTGMLKSEKCAENKKITQKFFSLLCLIKNNKSVGLIFNLIITSLFFIVVNKSVNLAQIKQMFSSVNVCQLSIAIIWGLVGFYFQILRWKEILHSQKFPSTLIISTKTFFIGTLLGFVTPGGLGELVRGWKLTDNKYSSVILVIVDRFYAILMFLFFGVLSVAIHLAWFDIVNINKLKFLITISVMSLAIIGIVFKYYKKILARFKNEYITIIVNIIDELCRIKNWRILFYSIISYIILVVQTAVIVGVFDSLSFEINLLIASETYLFMLFFPFFIANIGLREYSFMFFLTEFSSHTNNVIPSVAFGISTLILLINVIFPALTGLILSVGESIGRRKINLRGK